MSETGTQDFGALLRAHRRDARLTQEELAERTGYSSDYLSKLERAQRRPSARAVEAVTLALGLNAAGRARLEEALHGGPAIASGAGAVRPARSDEVDRMCRQLRLRAAALEALAALAASAAAATAAAARGDLEGALGHTGQVRCATELLEARLRALLATGDGQRIGSSAFQAATSADGEPEVSASSAWATREA